MGSLKLQCVSCQEWLPDEAFYRNRSLPDRRGRDHYCRECRTAWMKQPRECVRCSSPTPSREARLCDSCRPEHASGVSRDLWLDRFGDTKRWTREAIIELIQKWAEKYGEPPRFNDWFVKAKTEWKFGEVSKRTWPYSYTVVWMFGSWNAAIEAAGFKPRPLRREGNTSRPNGKTCRNGLHPWIPENIRTEPNGDRRCRLCQNARVREYQERKRHARR